MKTYSGKRDRTGLCHVWVVTDGESKLLSPRTDLANHSPTGFEWGYAGSGPAQLALAILADALEKDDELALEMHQLFKFKMITTLTRSKDWVMSKDEVLGFAMEYMRRRVE